MNDPLDHQKKAALPWAAIALGAWAAWRQERKSRTWDKREAREEKPAKRLSDERALAQRTDGAVAQGGRQGVEASRKIGRFSSSVASAWVGFALVWALGVSMTLAGNVIEDANSVWVAVDLQSPQWSKESIEKIKAKSGIKQREMALIEQQDLGSAIGPQTSECYALTACQTVGVSGVEWLGWLVLGSAPMSMKALGWGNSPALETWRAAHSFSWGSGMVGGALAILSGLLWFGWRESEKSNGRVQVAACALASGELGLLMTVAGAVFFVAMSLIIRGAPIVPLDSGKAAHPAWSVMREVAEGRLSPLNAPWETGDDIGKGKMVLAQGTFDLCAEKGFCAPSLEEEAASGQKASPEVENRRQMARRLAFEQRRRDSNLSPVFLSLAAALWVGLIGWCVGAIQISLALRDEAVDEWVERLGRWGRSGHPILERSQLLAEAKNSAKNREKNPKNPDSSPSRKPWLW